MNPLKGWFLGSFLSLAAFAGGLETELLQASLAGDVPALRQLLAKGISIHTASKYGTTPLMKAAWAGHREAVKLLLGRGADPDRGDREGETALMKAAFSGHVEIVSLLLDAGAAIDSVDQKSETALMFAARSWHKNAAAVAALLLERGAAAQVRDRQGWNALYFAASEGNRQVMDLLLEGAASEVGMKADADKARRLLMAYEADVKRHAKSEIFAFPVPARFSADSVRQCEGSMNSHVSRLHGNTRCNRNAERGSKFCWLHRRGIY